MMERYEGQMKPSETNKDVHRNIKDFTGADVRCEVR